jgi:hypothetical protein
MSAAAVGLCLSLMAGPAGAHAAAPATATVFVPGERFILAWVHSIEKTRWEEDYAVVADASSSTGARLIATEARIRGSGAGMEPPPGAVWRDGWYAYVPAERQPALLRLTRSGYVPDYELCPGGAGCRPLGHWLAGDGGVTEVRACG